jgi:RNA polymerase sigma factor (sigma-70 family)
MPKDAAGLPLEGTDSKIAAAIARLRKGDPTAKNDLLSYAQRQFERMARALLHSGGSYEAVQDWEQTDDVVQEVQIRMSRALDSVKEIESPRDFFKLAANHIHWQLKALLATYKAEKRGGGHRVTNVKPNRKGGAPIVGGVVDDAEAPRDTFAEVSRYLDEIGTIPADEREMLDLIVILGLTREEAAARLGLTLATFKRRYRKACHRLYRDMTDDDRPHHE